MNVAAALQKDGNVSAFVLAGDIALDTPCITCAGVTRTRADVMQDAERVGQALAQVGLGEGDLVVVHLPNGLDVIPVILGTWASGVAVAPVNTALGIQDRDRALRVLGPAGVITTAEHAASIAEVLPDAVVLIPQGWKSAGASTRPPDARVVPAGTALVLHTSGTSGTPKAVLLSHRSLTGALESVLRMLGARATRGGGGAPNLVAFPLAHVAGLYNVLLAFRNGREVILMPRFAVDPFVAIVKERSISSVVLNPTMMQMVLAAGVPAQDLRTLRFVRSGSAPLPVSLAKRFFAAYGIPVLNGYGQTETAGEVIGWNAADLATHREAKVGSVGRPHPGVAIRFIDEDLATVADGDVGELCVSTPFAMTGYLAGVADDKYTADGYLRTGDLGYLDGDGFVWLVGRRSDVIVCGGYKVMPEEVEDVLRDHPSVTDVMVAGVEDERLGEAPHAFVVLAQSVAGQPADLPAALIELVRSKLSHYKAPRAVHLVSELPRNATGKVLRQDAARLIPLADAIESSGQ